MSTAPSVSGFSLPLLIVTIIVAVIILCANVYVLISYQHPEDRNQAWFPKLIVVFGLSLACWTLLMLPMDVANRAACPVGTALTTCNPTFPMATLWYIAYITNIVLVFAIIPFAYFYYEADSELYVVVCAGVCVGVHLADCVLSCCCDHSLMIFTGQSSNAGSLALSTAL